MANQSLPRPLIGWPLLPLPDAHGRLNYPTLDQSVRQSIEVILRTRPGEQLMRPDFGAGLAAFLHEPNVLTTRRRIRARAGFGEGWPAGEQPVAMACSPQGRLALLAWATGGDARLHCLSDKGTLLAPMTLHGARWPYSLAWVAEDRVAVLVTGLPKEAPVYSVVAGTAHADPVGDLYPLRDDHTGGPFLHGVTLPPHYPTPTGAMPLHRLSLPSFARQGIATNQPLLDGGSAQTVWHRLYLEAAIPAHCGVTVFLAASDDPTPPAGSQDWYPHHFGERFAREGGAGLPRGAWVSSRSEVPYHPGLLACEPEPNRAGLFTVLIQRSHRRVRTLRGRYLWVRVELVGDGRATPEVAAVRAYASRFSYLNRYLPELYHETLFGPDADAITPADQPQSTPADFLERFLDNFEGILTPLEDRIASAYRLTDPRTTNEEALEWLGSWIGISFDPVSFRA